MKEHSRHIRPPLRMTRKFQTVAADNRIIVVSVAVSLEVSSHNI